MRRLVDAALEATVAGGFSRIGYEVRSRMDHWDTDFDLRDARILITGGTSGIGRAAAQMALDAGARVAITGRSRQRLDSAAVGLSARGQVTTIVNDAADLAAVPSVLEQSLDALGGLDVLVHNAGALDRTFARSPQGFEQTYAAHVLGPFALTAAAIPHLGTGGKVITVSSGGMYSQPLDPDHLQMGYTEYDGVRAYAIAKRAQVALNEAWARRYPNGPTFAAMHPGWADTPGVQTSLPGFRRVTRPILRTAEQGADTILWLASHDIPSGQFWLDRQPRAVVRLPWISHTEADVEETFERVAADAGVSSSVG